VQGDLLCEFLARGLVCFWWYLLFAGACFVSNVSSRCPCLRGPRLVLLQVILLFAFLWLSITCWSFLLLVSFLFFFSLVTNYVGVVNALIKGEIEDHVWFEDRWMVASLCDE
jgi:hypothetical protein